MTAEDRFLNMVVHCPSGCWMWTGAKDRTGYGMFTVGRKNRPSAHVWAYEHYKGMPEDGLEAHHICGIKGCVSPHHIEFVTRSEHLRRHNRNLADRDRCSHGHEYTDANTRIRMLNGKEVRICRMCEIRYAYEKKQREPNTQTPWRVKEDL